MFLQSSESASGSPGGPAILEPKITVVVETSEQPCLNRLYRVLLHNDDITPMEFVVHVLRIVFKKGRIEAIRIMLAAHFTGICLVVLLPLEEAELRVDQARSISSARSFPLTFTYEPEL